MFVIASTWFVHSLLVLLTVAFFTLFERNVIGLAHLRLGPSKVSFLGLLQPLLDAFKLLSKQNLVSLRASNAVYTLAPLGSLALSLTFWLFLPSSYFLFSNSYSFLAFLALGSLMVLVALLTGWSSNSNYSFLGCLRSVAQSVSYESVVTTLVIFFCVLFSTYSLCSISYANSVLTITIFPIWFFCMLAEAHRAPFDFAESESELVSGYNTEYGGAFFAFLFLGEYCVLLFSSAVVYFLFVPLYSCILISPFMLSAGVLLVSSLSILVRISFCRFRYDFLIALAWKSLLPLSLFCLALCYWLV